MRRRLRSRDWYRPSRRSFLPDPATLRRTLRRFWIVNRAVSRWGLVYRSGSLAHLTASDLARLAPLGVTDIFDPAGGALGSFTLLEPLDAVFIDDHRVFHGVTAIEPVDPTRPAYRDVLVVTFRRGDP